MQLGLSFRMSFSIENSVAKLYSCFNTRNINTIKGIKSNIEKSYQSINVHPWIPHILIIIMHIFIIHENIYWRKGYIDIWTQMDACLNIFLFMHVLISARISQVVNDPPTKAMIGSYVGVRNYWKVDKPENFF